VVVLLLPSVVLLVQFENIPRVIHVNIKTGIEFFILVSFVDL